MFAGNERKRVEVLTSILDVKAQANQRIKTLEHNLIIWDGLFEINVHTQNRIDTLKQVLKRLDIRYYRTLKI
tara:strand:- start:24 stop:239 length:216 start_codon:yes stop_codon:yes gene_type:complete